MKGVDILFVLIPQIYHIQNTGWYQIYSYKMLRDLNADFRDMRIPLKQYMDGHKYTSLDIYQLDFHPNETENKIMADYILSRLQNK